MHRSKCLYLFVALSPLLVACSATSQSFGVAQANGLPMAVLITDQGDAVSLNGAVPVNPPARADSPPLPAEDRSANLYHKLGLRVGGVAFRSFDTTLQVNTDAGLGANLDFEDLLGVDASSTVLRMDGFYAFNDRHRVDLSYYDIGRTGTRRLLEDIQVGDTLIQAGETVSNLDTRIMKADYRYNFVTDPKAVLAASFGLHVMRIDLGIRSNTHLVEKVVGVTAPLPVIGLHSSYALSKNLALRAAGELFQAKAGNFDGLLTDFRLGLDWDITKHVGLGLEMNTFNMRMGIQDGPRETKIEYGYTGFGLYLRIFL